jgi:hypothetical protein
VAISRKVCYLAFDYDEDGETITQVSIAYCDQPPGDPDHPTYAIPAIRGNCYTLYENLEAGEQHALDALLNSVIMPILERERPL